jgi:hypothetical protein
MAKASVTARQYRWLHGAEHFRPIKDKYNLSADQRIILK